MAHRKERLCTDDRLPSWKSVIKGHRRLSVLKRNWLSLPPPSFTFLWWELLPAASSPGAFHSLLILNGTMRRTWTGLRWLQGAACQTVKPSDGAAVGLSGAAQRPSFDSSSGGEVVSISRVMELPLVRGELPDSVPEMSMWASDPHETSTRWQRSPALVPWAQAWSDLRNTPWWVGRWGRAGVSLAFYDYHIIACVSVYLYCYLLNTFTTCRIWTKGTPSKSEHELYEQSCGIKAKQERNWLRMKEQQTT